MKRIIAILLIMIMFTAALAACGSDNSETKANSETNDNSETNGNGTSNDAPSINHYLPEWMSGKEAASLILANQRLDSQLLKNSKNIFEDGSATLTNLANKAEKNLVRYTYLSASPTAITPLASTKYENPDGSTVENNGDIFRWSNFSEYSNSYDYFLNLTNGISASAKQGADLIDNVKKYVRVVDKWVNVYGTEYYLHVEEDCEILFSRDEDQINMCMRTKTEGGDNRYDIYYSNDIGQTRMVYVAGKLCEYSHINSTSDFNHNFLAENTKGYWEVADVGINPEGHNVTCIVLKDDICYRANYSPDENGGDIGSISIISSDKKTDLLTFSDFGEMANVIIPLQGFSGYKYIEGTFPENTRAPWGESENNPAMYYDDQYYEDLVIYVPFSYNELSLMLNNGIALRAQDKLNDGEISVSYINVSHFSKESGEGAEAAGKYSHGYTADIALEISAIGIDEQWALLESFFNQTGLKPNRDMKYIKSGIIQAQKELEQFVKYHEWNESPIYTKADIDKGWKNNLAKHAAHKAEYDKIKDAEILDYSSKYLIELNIKFAPITAQTSASVYNDGFVVNVRDLELTVNDTMLYVVGEKYTVNFALVKSGDTSSADLVHIDLAESISTEFKGGKSFSVKQTTSFELPTIDFELGDDVSEYNLVAYISTADGIRSSGYTELVFTKLTPVERNVGVVNVGIVVNDESKLAVVYSENREIEVSISEGAKTSTEMYEELAKAAHKYGLIEEGASLQVLGEDGDWYDVENSEEPLPDGTYRLHIRCYDRNGDTELLGDVQTKYKAP